MTGMSMSDDDCDRSMLLKYQFPKSALGQDAPTTFEMPTTLGHTKTLPLGAGLSLLDARAQCLYIGGLALFPIEFGIRPSGLVLEVK